MEKFPAGQIVKSGRTFPIYVTDYGRWGTEEMKNITTDTREALEKKIAQHVQKTTVKVAVPFVQLHRQAGRLSVRHGTATGIHGNTGNVLVQWADGKREQVRSFHDPRVSTLRGLPADKIHEWARLTKAVLDATGSLKAFEEEYKIDMVAEIKSRQQVAVDEAADPAE